MYSSYAVRLRLGTPLATQISSQICLRLPASSLAGNGLRNILQSQASLSIQVAKYTTTSKYVNNSAPEVSSHPRRQNGKHTSKSLFTQRSPVSSSRPQAQPRRIGGKQLQLELAVPTPAKPDLRNSAQKLARFQEKLVEIRANMDDQVTNLDLMTKILGVEKDQLHPLVHCKHMLELDTSSALQGLLQAIADKTPKGKRHTTQEDSTVIWLESRILAVQLWVIKRLFLQMKLLEIENEGKRAQARSLLQDAERQICQMSSQLAILRDMFHRVRPECVVQSPEKGWTNAFFVKEHTDADSDDLILAPEAQPPVSQVNHTGTLVSRSIFLENLGAIAAYSRRESVIWKIERFLSRVEEVYYRISRVIGLLDQLAHELQVAEDRTHPVVSCKHILQLNSSGSLDMVLRVLRKRIPKNQIELEQGMGEALWLGSRLPEVQLEVVKMRLWAFHLTMKGQNLPHQQKNLIRSIRGRIKVAHSLLRNSRKEFSSYRPPGQFEIGTKGREGTVTKEGPD
ncbi:hypothetical protein OPQ81_007070 [Rhizoctonia solani]|nr:hypothetical protein OPQ81_007070 [Rhizoctonia solani]